MEHPHSPPIGHTDRYLSDTLKARIRFADAYEFTAFTYGKRT